MATTYDIHFQLVDGAAQSEGYGKVFTFGFKTAVGVRGPQKLVNRWVKCLMTPKGSDPFDTSYGTGFPSLIGSNITRDQDMRDAIAIFVEDCNKQIYAMDRRNFPPDDERLKSASLFRIIALNDDGYDIYVHIRNVAGQILTLQLPTIETRP